MALIPAGRGPLRTASYLLALVLCLLLAFLLQPSPLDGASSGASGSSLVDFDPDEMEGLPAPTASGEILINDDADDMPPPIQSIWVDPNAPVTPVVPPGATDPTRTVKSLDWVHVQYEVRTVRDDGDDRPGRLIDTTRKHGRHPWVVDIGSGHAIPQIEQALIGLTIGDRRTVNLEWEESFHQLEPRSEGLAKIETGEMVGVNIEVVRFDKDFKEPTIEEKSVDSDRRQQFALVPPF